MVLVSGTDRETPVGPPWITTSRGYLRDGSKSAGLCRTPSMAAPSWLFHDTTSRVPIAKRAICAFMSVSFVGFASVAGPTNTSAIDAASAPKNAAREPSRESVKFEPTQAAAGERRVTAFDAGSSRNRYE